MCDPNSTEEIRTLARRKDRRDRLADAAPELLSALQNLHRIANAEAGSNPKVAAALKAARAAIKRAEG